MIRNTQLRCLKVLVAVTALILITPSPGFAQSRHPMDALGRTEVVRAVELIKQAGHGDENSRFPTVALKEMPKQQVLDWKQGDSVSRAAFVVMRHQGSTFEIEVDLTAGQVRSVQRVDGQPGVVIDEWLAASRLTMAHEEWRAAIAKRGMTSLDKIFCSPLTSGRFAKADYGAKRVMKVPCYVRDPETSHFFGRPIDGLFTVVDVQSEKVIEVVDLGVVDAAPAPKPAKSLRSPIKPVVISSPQGANYRISGAFQVAWGPWNLHLRIDKRVGPVVSLVRYNDLGRDRLIAYQMSLSEIFVPYMAPEADWEYRAYVDSGEFGAGVLLSSLVAGADCPEQSAYLSAPIPNDKGQTFEIRRAACLFERATGDPLWRHGAPAQPTQLTRPDIELVLRSITTIGNYDYAIDWVFRQDGNIEMRVGATGIIAVRGTQAANMAAPTAAADTAYGELVAPGTIAVYHDHFFNFRLDLDVDGTANTLIRDSLVPQRLPDANLRRSLWTLQRSPVVAEGPVSGGGNVARWRLVNPGAITVLGHQPGVEIVTGGQATSILAPDDESQARAAFSASTLWLTRHHPRELYAAGDYPNQSRGGEGLPAYAANADPVENTDIVVWANLGMHHVTRVEDWPIMPVRWKNLTLRPFNFFEQNPAFGIPPGFARPEPPSLRSTIDSDTAK